MLTPEEQEFLAIYRSGNIASLRRWCQEHPSFPFRGLHNPELSDGFFRMVCDAVAKTLRYSA